MAESMTYRCYYDDGTILMNAQSCPFTNESGAALVTSELTLVEDVTGQIQWPWILLVLGLLLLTSKKGN